uniref:Putative cytochrome n=1 Tax=Panstrongylus lignarius TaxID=156445 RepID=A0A224XLI6_9HEMI
MDPITTSLVSVLLTIFLYIIYKAWKAHQYWKEKGVPYKKPPFFVGSTMPILLRKMTPGELQETIYKQFPNESLTGYYDFLKPLLMVRDPALIERIFIKDFTNFVDHGLPVDEERNPLAANLFAMTGKRWKAVRNRLSPIFTIGKLKLMFESMKGCGDEMIKLLDKGPTEDVEMKEILGCFAMDTIGSCAFGIDAGNLSNPDNEFRNMGKKVFQLDTLTFLGILLLRQFPNLAKYLNITITKPHITKYFSNIIKDTVTYRRGNGFIRNDFIQLMMQLQDKGHVEMHTKDEADDYLNIDTTAYSTEKFELTDDQIIGHAVFFLTGGLDTTTMAMTFTLYELSRNPTIQKKVREEILREVEQAGSLTYDSLSKMHYLEQCIKEALRMYPPSQVLGRMCTKQYTFPNGLTIDPGQMIAIPAIAIHNDPKYYPEPRVYRPERFDPDQKIPACAYLPFGNGPRMCIAMRFAMLEMKYCLANLLQNYTTSLSPKTKPIKLSTRSLVLMSKDPLYFNIKKRKMKKKEEEPKEEDEE